jgi:Glycosyl transferase family 2
MPLFSIIIPTFNRAYLLTKTLASVASQDLADAEVLVIDDGSTDDTENVVRNCGFKVRFERQSRKGPGAARNLGWNLAQGDYIAFLDSDDLWFPWTLDTFRNCIATCQHPRFVVGMPFLFREETELTAVNRAPVEVVAYRDYLASAEDAIWMGSGGMLLRRDCPHRFEAQLMNEEDSDLALHLGVEEGFVVIRQPFAFAYRQHGASTTYNFDCTYRGVLHLIQEEKRGHFPGGAARRRERLLLLTHTIRPPLLGAIRDKHPISALRLYFETFGWHICLKRWELVLKAPLLALASLLGLYGDFSAESPWNPILNPILKLRKRLSNPMLTMGEREGGMGHT